MKDNKFKSFFLKIYKSKKTKLILNISLWAIIAGLFVYSGCGLIDKKTGYKFLKTHTSVIVSNSMSYVNKANYSYLDKNVEHYAKGDIVKSREYKTFDDIKNKDIITYLAVDGNLVCHRVVGKYEEDGQKYVVTRGDANAINDAPVNYKFVRGKVVKNTKKAGKIILFFQSVYFLFALFGSAFFILLGMLIAGIKTDKKDKKLETNKSKKN